MDRAVSLMAELSGGVVRTGACTQEPKLWAAPHPRFRVQRTVDLLGMDVEPAFCADTLERLGCGLDRSDEADWKVTTPSWRSDLSREVDLIEEIARVKGMDTIPETLPAVSRPLDRFGQPESRYGFLSRIKAWGRGLGLNEAENYSFVGHKDPRSSRPFQGRPHRYHQPADRGTERAPHRDRPEPVAECAYQHRARQHGRPPVRSGQRV